MLSPRRDPIQRDATQHGVLPAALTRLVCLSHQSLPSPCSQNPNAAQQLHTCKKPQVPHDQCVVMKIQVLQQPRSVRQSLKLPQLHATANSIQKYHAYASPLLSPMHPEARCSSAASNLWATSSPLWSCSWRKNPGAAMTSRVFGKGLSLPKLDINANPSLKLAMQMLPTHLVLPEALTLLLCVRNYFSRLMQPARTDVKLSNSKPERELKSPVIPWLSWKSKCCNNLNGVWQTWSCPNLSPPMQIENWKLDWLWLCRVCIPSPWARTHVQPSRFKPERELKSPVICFLFQRKSRYCNDLRGV